MPEGGKTPFLRYLPLHSAAFTSGAILGQWRQKKYLRNRRLGVYADLRQFGIILAAAGIISFFLDDSVSVGAAAR